jgi:hypothetical protein
MKYNVPYGLPDEVTWGDTPYINGNPATGQAGSIPPAASIENPQREIVNLIKATGVVPSNSDLSQLGRGVQSGSLIFAIAAGTPNAISVNLNPAPLVIHEGFVLWIRTSAPNTDRVYVDVNALGGMEVLLMDGTTIKPGTWGTSWYIGLVADANAHWVLFSASASVLGGQTKLIANRQLYVNGTTGDDTLYNGSSPTVVSGTNNGPFKTIQKGVTTVGLIDLNGYSATVHVADGTYPESVTLPGVSPNGIAELSGNDTNWQNVAVNAPTGPAIRPGPGNFLWNIHGFHLSSGGPSAGGEVPCGLYVTGAGHSLAYWNIEFGPVTSSGYHILAQYGGIAEAIFGPSQAFSGGGLRIVGGALAHLWANNGTISQWQSAPMTIVGAPAFTYYAQCGMNGTIAQTYSAITGSGTGAKYSVYGNGVINFNGNPPATYYPVPGAGVAATGGQVI